MVAIKNTLALTVLASVVSAQNPIVASLINDIVEGIAAAKTDNDVSDEAATSEIQSVVGIIQQNTDVQQLVSQVIPIAAMGLNDDNFPQVLSAAHATLEAFQGSPEYPEAVKGLKDVLPHYDVQQALGNVQNNLGNVLALVTPSLPSLTPNHSEQWEAATKNVQALAASLGFLPGGDNKQAEATSAAEASKTEASASASATEASKTEESKPESKSQEASKTEESKSESKSEESKAESKTEDASSAAATSAEASKTESKAESSAAASGSASGSAAASGSASASGSAAASSKAEESKAESAKPTSASASATGASSAAASASASVTAEQGNGAAAYNLALGGVVGAAAMVVALL